MSSPDSVIESETKKEKVGLEEQGAARLRVQITGWQHFVGIGRCSVEMR